MSAYMIAFVDLTDPEQYAEYTKHTPRIIAKYGGRFIARGGEPTVLEGPDESRRIVIVEFPNAEQAKAFYDSEEYGKAKAIRSRAATMHSILIDEFSDADWHNVLDASQQLSFD